MEFPYLAPRSRHDSHISHVLAHHQPFSSVWMLLLYALVSKSHREGQVRYVQNRQPPVFAPVDGRVSSDPLHWVLLKPPEVQ